MAADRKATTIWQGDLASGSGETSLDSSNVAGPLAVTWAARTEQPGGKTSPEELIAAAHASCFSMSFSKALAAAGNAPERLETSAVVTFVPGTGVTKSALTVRGTVPGMDAEAFRQAAEGARDRCPVSQALKGNVELSVDAQLA